MITTPNALGLPAVQWGTNDIYSLLRVKNQVIIDFGIQDVELGAQVYLNEYNAQVKENIGFFVEDVTERTEGVGGAAPMQMVGNEEYGRVDVQKVGGANMLGYPMRRWDLSTQWTWDWFEKKTPHDLAYQVINAAAADARRVRNDIQQALFSPVNYLYTDSFVDGMTLPVKALANADNFPIQPSPNGQTFNPATHSHYMGTAGNALAASDVDALLANVTEHHSADGNLIILPPDVEAYMSGNANLFPMYQRLVYSKQVPGTLATHMEGTLEVGATIDRMTGTYRDADVWIKPWMPAGYLCCIHVGDIKPLARRTEASISSTVAPGDFRMIYESTGLPLNCKTMRRQHGFAVRNRVGAAVMSVGSQTYTAPSNYLGVVTP